jgi:hypothetical protein
MENGCFHLFAAKEKQKLKTLIVCCKRKFAFLGWQTINSNG